MTKPQGGDNTEGGHPQPESPPTSSTTVSGGTTTDGGHPQPEGEPTE